MANKLLSIIIPVYNVERYITKCLRSIFDEGEATLEKIEVIAVDDGSTDRSGAIADKFAGKFPCMRVIHKKNAGVAAARNTGIDSACGEWLYFADSDDWLEKGGVSEICFEIERTPDADVMFMEAYENSGNAQKKWEHFRADADLADGGGHDEILRLQCSILYAPFWKDSKNIPLAAPWDKAYRREFLLKNNIRFCERLKVLDDMAFNYEVFGAAKKVVCRKIRPYHYRRVADSITNSYNPNRVRQDMAVWKYIVSKNCTSSDAEDDLLRQRAFMCRIVKSFGICCRLSFFNDKNEKPLKHKAAYVEKVMKSEPYRTAFRNVRLADLEWRLKIMAIVGRIGSGWGAYFLYAVFMLTTDFICRAA